MALDRYVGQYWMVIARNKTIWKESEPFFCLATCNNYTKDTWSQDSVVHFPAAKKPKIPKGPPLPGKLKGANALVTLPAASGWEGGGQRPGLLAALLLVL